MTIILTAILSVLATLAIQWFERRRLRASAGNRIRAQLRVAATYVKVMRAAKDFLLADDLLFPFRQVVIMLEDTSLLADQSAELANELAGLQVTAESYLAVVARPDAATQNLEGRVRTMESYIDRSLELLGDSKFARIAEAAAHKQIAIFKELDSSKG